jgi:hypothetical protein
LDRSTGIRAGLDRLTGGSWLDLDDRGVVPAAVLNKVGTLGPGDGKKDRGAISC